MPEFASADKASDLFSKLGPKLWLMMVAKYDLAKIVAVCSKQRLQFPDAVEFRELARAVAEAVAVADADAR